jgi:hypothetical protein
MGKIAAIFMGIVLFLWIGAAWDTSHTNDQVVAAETAMKSDLDANLVKGESPQDLDKILATHELTQHTYLNMHAPVPGMDGASGMEVAMQGPFGSPLHQCDLAWNFYFDESDRFIRYKDSALCKNSIAAGTREAGEPMRPGVDEPAPNPYRKQP